MPVNYPSSKSQYLKYNAYRLNVAYPMILIFLDLKGAPFHSPIELKITMNSIRSQKHLPVSPYCQFSDLRLRFFSTQVENRTRAPWRWVNMPKGKPGIATWLTPSYAPDAFAGVPLFLACLHWIVLSLLCFSNTLMMLPPSLLSQALLLLLPSSCCWCPRY